MKFISFLLIIMVMMSILSPIALASEGSSNAAAEEQESVGIQPLSAGNTGPQAINPLTGMPARTNTANHRPIAVSFNNTIAALPQHGISQADIIYEMLVEGGMTRMLALFHDVASVGNIGSIRSMRPYMHFIADSYNAIYVHGGGSDEAMWLINSWNVNRLDGVFGPGLNSFFRMPGRQHLHALFTTGTNIEQGIGSLGYNRNHSPGHITNLSFTDNATPQGGRAATGVDVRFSSTNTTRFSFCHETNRYFVTLHDNLPYIDGNNNTQVAVTNILVLRAETQTIDGDGRLSIQTTFRNYGYFINGGRAVEIYWRRPETWYQYEYYLMDGTPLVLGRGRTYIAVVPTNAQIRFTGAETGTAFHNGIDFSRVYDFAFYMHNNPDVAAVFGGDQRGAIAHFFHNGMSEGRIAHPSFNVHHYRNANPDLRVAFGSDLRAYFMHYIWNGHAENRGFSAELINPITVHGGTNFALVYDMNTYLELNPDVYAAFGRDEVRVLAHFVHNGMSEGRIAHENFNVHHYRQSYADLQAAFGYDLRAFFLHYIHNGHNEGRSAALNSEP